MGWDVCPGQEPDCRARGKRRGFRPGFRPGASARHRSQTTVPLILVGFLPFLFETVFFLFFFFSVFLRSDFIPRKILSDFQKVGKKKEKWDVQSQKNDGKKGSTVAKIEKTPERR